MKFEAWDRMQRYERYQELRKKKRRCRTLQNIGWYLFALAVGWCMGMLMMSQESRAESPCDVLLGRIKGESTELLAYDGGHQVGYIYYSVIAPSHAIVNLVSVISTHKRKGVSKALFAEMLKRHPNIRRVDAILVGDNLKAATVAGGEPISFEGCELAVKNTPFYKSLAALGFYSVRLCEFNSVLGILEVGLGV